MVLISNAGPFKVSGTSCLISGAGAFKVFTQIDSLEIGDVTEGLPIHCNSVPRD